MKPTVATNYKDIRAVEEMCKVLSRILVGNGDKVGMDEEVRRLGRDIEDVQSRLERLENKSGVIESEVKETKRMVQGMVGYSGVRYSSESHPGRRNTDEGAKKASWFTDKVAPGLVQYFIIAVISGLFSAVGLLILLHATDFIG